MIALLRDMIRTCNRHRPQLLLLLGLVVVVIVVLAGFLKFQTTRSSFCDTCHYMDPYVRHWQASTHADFDCVKCHDYGATDLAFSTLKYWTGTYNNRPKANVHDENCLASGCHDKQLLIGTTEYRKGILFDHAGHLEKALRGEHLRCTSCHNQIVQYDDEVQQHMTVNDKSCFVCHFKDAGAGEAITGCDACHGMPKTEVEHAGFVFNHEPYLKLGVECKQCHTNIVRGDGSVPAAKCYTCHVERSSKEHSREELHNIHVTTNGIDCYKCHTDIEHGNFEMVSALNINCENCHLRQHNRPEQMYMGIGGRDAVDMPSDMFLAQVSCNGCHTHVTPEGEIMAHQEKKEAARNSCVTCHGREYDLMFDNWIAGTKTVLADYGKFLKAAKADLGQIGGGKKARTAAKAALSKAEYNYYFVRDGQIPHNIKYAVRLLAGGAVDFEAAMKKIKKTYKVPSAGNGIEPAGTCLTFCHGQGLNPETVEYDGGDLPHKLHIEDMELGCESCHSVSEHGKTRVQESVCAECH